MMSLKAKLLVATLLTLLVLLQAGLWGRQGLIDLWRLHTLNADSEAENQELRVLNRALARDVADMKSGYGGVEKEAREELGMVKQGETFFRVTEFPPEGAGLDE